jgi:hypothetical protein
MANGTIAFDTLQTSGQIDGTARSIDTDYILNGSGKAWVNYNSSTAIRDSFNISTLDDDGTGDYTAHVTNAFANDDFSATIGGSNGTASATAYGLSTFDHTTSSVEMETFAVSASSVAKADRAQNNMVLHGELA